MTPMQVAQYDGEVLTPVSLPLTCKVLPSLLQVVMPKPDTSSRLLVDSIKA
jgi:diacylglycerol kinase family enzyme